MGRRRTSGRAPAGHRSGATDRAILSTSLRRTDAGEVNECDGRQAPAHPILEDLIREGLVRPPLVLRRTYRGGEVRARVEVDGSVSVDAERVPTLSTAGDLARTKVLMTQGEKATVTTNGWVFWRFVDAEGKTTAVNGLRRRFVASRASAR